MSVIDEEEYRLMFQAAEENLDVLSDIVDGKVMEDDIDKDVYNLVDAGVAFRGLNEENESYFRANELGDLAYEALEEDKTEEQFVDDMMEAEEEFETDYSSGTPN